MARDPLDNSEIQRQRRSLARQQEERDRMATGYIPQVGDQNTPSQPTSLGRTIRDEAGAAVDAIAGPIAYGLAGFRGADPSSSDLSGRVVTQPTSASTRAQVNLVEPQLADPATVRRAANTRGSGLTRIVKTGDGTYVQTSDPNVRGQERYYDQLGNRADVNQADVFTPGRQFADVQDLARAEQNAATRMSTAGGREAILAQGRRSLERTNQMASDAVTASQKAFLDSLDPKTRANLLSEQAKEAGLDRRAAAQLQVQREGQRAALVQANNAVNKTAFDQDLTERQRLQENPQFALQELFGSMANLSPEEQVQALSNPNDPRAARARAALTTAAQQTALGPNFTPAQATRASGLRRFLHSPLTLGLTAPAFDSNNGALFDTQFDASDLGLTEAQLDALIRADAQVRSRNR